MTKEDLDSYNFSSYDGFNAQLIAWRYEVLSKYYSGKTCLELGSADGQGTIYLLDYFEQVTAVDGSPKAIEDLKHKYQSSKLTAVCAFFEELKLAEQFDTVIMAHILEHVDDPQTVLAAAKKFLKPGGVMIVDVPNGLSLHRQIGVKMGMLKYPTELNDADRSIGHKRVYTPGDFKAEFAKAGLKIKHFGGVFIKVLSNAQTADTFNKEQLKAFLEVGKDNPEIAAEMFVVAAAD